VWETTFCGRPCIIKQRFSKKYRHPALDRKLTVARLKQVRGQSPALCHAPAARSRAAAVRSRAAAAAHPSTRPRAPASHRRRQEARSVLRARKIGVPVPALFFVEMETSSIYMEHVAGHSIRHLLQAGSLDEAGARWLQQWDGSSRRAAQESACGKGQQRPLRQRFLKSQQQRPAGALPAACMPPPHRHTRVPTTRRPPARTRPWRFPGRAARGRVMADVGRLLALLHDSGLIHGDLTTSNMLVRKVRGRPRRGSRFPASPGSCPQRPAAAVATATATVRAPQR
jgi:tRNA A-37 threonylcarbamoyl transferase component Bud32